MPIFWILHLKTILILRKFSFQRYASCRHLTFDPRYENKRWFSAVLKMENLKCRANEVKTCGLVQPMIKRILRDLILQSHDSHLLNGDPPLVLVSTKPSDKFDFLIWRWAISFWRYWNLKTPRYLDLAYSIQQRWKAKESFCKNRHLY